MAVRNVAYYHHQGLDFEDITGKRCVMESFSLVR